jgi:hypothetical protein
MRGHSRPKDGVASLAYDPRIPIRLAPFCHMIEIAGSSPAMTGFGPYAGPRPSAYEKS